MSSTVSPSPTPTPSPSSPTTTIKSKLPIAVGIDLGTTNSCVGWWNKSKADVDIIPNEFGNRTTPSYVSFSDTVRYVGESAKNQQTKNPENTIYESKRFIGRVFSDNQLQQDLNYRSTESDMIRSKFPFRVVDIGDDKPQFLVNIRGEDRLFYPEEIGAMILGKMKEIAENTLNAEVKRAVITVPAYFNDAQRQATRDAGHISGLEVLRIINEPTAAAIAYGLDKKTKDLSKEINVLVFDLGGGTLDTSLLTISLDGVFEVRAINGDTRLGGADFDNRLIEWCAKKFKEQSGFNVYDNSRSLRKLRTACENAKCALSSSEQISIEIDGLMNNTDFNIDITRIQFEDMCSDLFKRCIDLTKNTLKDANMIPSQIEDVVLVGGSTRIPRIQELLSALFADVHGNPRKLCKSINPDEAVAYGAAIQAAMLNYIDNDERERQGVLRDDDEQYDENLPDYVLLDVNPLSLGIETTGGVMNVIIPRNTCVPIAKTKIFSTVEDNQTTVTISVFEGERTMTKHNNLLGEFELSGLVPLERGMPQIEVTFEIDADGIFTVKARDITNGSKQSHSDYKTLQIKQSKHSKDDVEQLVNNAKKFEDEDRVYKELIRAKTQYLNMLYAARSLLTKEEKVIKHATQEEKDLLSSTLDDEMKWITENGSFVKEKEVYQNRLDHVQTSVITPIIDKINQRVALAIQTQL